MSRFFAVFTRHGWLIVEGRRGHYVFCDETRAYELATGSAYRVASCSGLVLESGGNVDFRATDAGQKKLWKWVMRR